jgi:hypothetical protein
VPYPTSFDNLATNAKDGDDAGDDTPGSVLVGPHSDKHNKVAAAVNALQSVLGLNPQGGSTDVKTRIAAAEATAAGAVPKSLVTAAGDLIYATASGVLARLGIGANGKVLMSNGTAPVWADPPATPTVVQVDEGGVLIGTEAGIDFVAGTNMDIDATDDLSAGLVHLTFNATAGGSGGISKTVSYYIYKTGANYGALSPVGLPEVVATGTDAAAVLQSCMDNMNSSTSPRGTIIFAPNTTFDWKTIPTFRRTSSSGGSDDGKWLRLLGSGGSVIKLTVAGKTFIQPNRQADYDSFSGLEIGNLQLDANFIDVDTNHLFGTRNLASFSIQRCNIGRIYIHDIDAINIKTALTAGAGYSSLIWLRVNHLGVAEGTANYMTNIRCEHISIQGGNIGIVISATNTGGGGQLGVNVHGDGWYLDDIYFNPFAYVGDEVSCKQGPAIQLGDSCAGELMEIRRVWIAGSTNYGLETNSFRIIRVSDVTAHRCRAEAFRPVNVNYVNGANANEQHTQSITYNQCSHEVGYVGQPASLISCMGWQFFSGTSRPDLGTITLRDCNVYCTGPLPLGCVLGPALFAFTDTMVINKIVLDNFSADIQFDVPDATNRTVTPIYFYKMAKHMVIRNMKVRTRGAQQSTGLYLIDHLHLNGQSNVRLDIDGLIVDDITTSRTVSTTIGLRIGGTAAAGQNDIGGCIRGLTVLATVDTSFKGIDIMPAATLTLRKLLIEDLDISRLGGSATPLVYQAAGENVAPVFIRNMKGRVDPPVEITFTPGATTVAAQYLGNFEGLMTLTGGTVTVIEVSTDNVTYRQIGTTTPLSFYIDNGWWVRMTYTVAPTCKVIPRR